MVVQNFFQDFQLLIFTGVNREKILAKGCRDAKRLPDTGLDEQAKHPIFGKGNVPWCG